MTRIAVQAQILSLMCMGVCPRKATAGSVHFSVVYNGGFLPDMLCCICIQLLLTLSDFR